MSNAKQNVHTNSSFRSNKVDSEYEDVVVGYSSSLYDEAFSVQKPDPSSVIHATLPNIPQRKVVTQIHQKIQISLPLLFLIIICSLIVIILTGVVTFLISKDTQPNQYAEKQDCFWSSWSFWSKCSITCGNGTQVRIRQQMNKTGLCSYNETHENRICSRDTCSGDDGQLDMKFSRTALHKNVFISADRTIISNIQTIITSKSADSQLKNYKGTISDICVGNNELIYYEVNYTYTIVKALTGTTLVLEVGLAERSKVDRGYYVGSNNVSGWSFHLANNADNNSVYFYAEDPVHQNIFRPFSNNTVGKKVHGKFKLFINRRRNEFSLRKDDSIFFVLKNVTSDGKLCPVFGVLNPHRVHAKLQLMNPRNFTYYPW